MAGVLSAPCYRGKKSAGTEKGAYVTYNPLGLRQHHFYLPLGARGAHISEKPRLATVGFAHVFELPFSFGSFSTEREARLAR